MAKDAVKFISQYGLSFASLLGQLISGKTTVLTALFHPELIDNRIIVDRAP